MALDRLLDPVTDVAKDLRDEGTRTVHETSAGLTLLAAAIAVMNLVYETGLEVRAAAHRRYIVGPRRAK